MKKDILFLCQFFYPEHNSSATLPFDTAAYLSGQGFSVDALVGYPKEYSTETSVPLRETARGVHIRRLRYLQLRRTGTLGRLINYFSFTLRVLLHLGVFRNYRSVIVYSNPPILPVAPLLAKRLFGTRIVFVAYDVYPEVAYASGALAANGLISRVMRRLNRALYRRADRVVALTDEMRGFLLSNRPELDAQRAVTIPNWAHEHTAPLLAETYDRFGIRPDQFVVAYFGNLGTAQDVQTMLDAARLLRGDDRVCFLVVGHGNKKAAFADRVEAEQLHNVRMYDFLTGEDFEQAVAVSSACIVSLEKGLMGTCAPSKYYSYLQGGKPVLAVVEPESYLAEEVTREQIGCAVNVGDGGALRDAILRMEADREACRAMGVRASALYEAQYAASIGLARYGALFQTLLRNEGDRTCESS